MRHVKDMTVGTLNLLPDVTNPVFTVSTDHLKVILFRP